MHQNTPIAAGGSSFDQIDSEKLFREIQLQRGMTFLDVACGYGYYSIAAAKYVGEAGIVYAIDLWKEGLEHLSNHIGENNTHNIQVFLADVTNRIPLENASVDICLLATVLHDFIFEKTEALVLKEIHRILKPSGKFAVVEFKKIAGKPGPPIEIRVTPEQVEKKITPYKFQFLKTVEIGEFNYMSLFEKKKA